MKILLTILLVCILSPAYGMIYTWTDSAGVSHFTNKEYEIPSRYRAKTKSLYPEQTDTATSQIGQTPQAGSEARPLVPTQQAKPDESEDQPRNAQPASTPDRQKKSSGWSSKRMKRSSGINSKGE